MRSLTIGELAKRCEINLETLRYYERMGLMPPPPRSQAGHRQYGESSADRLMFIRRAQSLGFSLTEIKELLELRRHNDDLCLDVVHRIDAKLQEVEKKIADLKAIQRALGTMKELCHGDCLIGDCPILESLEQAKVPRLRQATPRRVGRRA